MPHQDHEFTVRSTTYLEDLTLRLGTGLGNLPEATRERHAAFLKNSQRDDGGFAGREGTSDLYYTGFALRGLTICGHLHGDVAERAATFLRSQLTSQRAIIDFLSLIYAGRLVEMAAGIDVFADSAANWREAVGTELELLRRDDGGYAKGAEGARSSTYHSFLVLLCRELIDLPHVEPERIVAFIRSQRREDGGFVEIAPMRKSGTNPTAAAIGTLKLLSHLEEEICQDAAEFLADMQTDEGGLRANTRIPIADLLSTFTGLLTLQDLNGQGMIDSAAAMRYARSLENGGTENSTTENGGGGFMAAVWDTGIDVEYTFYGLGTLALLANE